MSIIFSLIFIICCSGARGGVGGVCGAGCRARELGARPALDGFDDTSGPVKPRQGDDGGEHRRVDQDDDGFWAGQ